MTPSPVNTLPAAAHRGLAAFPLQPGANGAITSMVQVNCHFPDQCPGIDFAHVDYAAGAFTGDQISVIDGTRHPNYRQSPNQFTAISDLATRTVTVLELDVGYATMTELVIALDAGALSNQATVPTGEILVGAIAAGVCPNGFAYLATTNNYHVLFGEAVFDGGLVPSSSRYLELSNFVQTPGLVRLNSADWETSSTSLAVTPAPGGNLFLAISTPAQIAVYLIGCD